MGSAITYARRYALTAMLGIVTEDDDGEAAKYDPQNSPKTSTRSRMPVNAPQTQNRPSDEPTQAGIKNQALNQPSESLSKLPQLDGIAYRILQADDGRDYIIASGNTLQMKGYLRTAGFRWDAQGKVWWKYADAS